MKSAKPMISLETRLKKHGLKHVDQIQTQDIDKSLILSFAKGKSREIWWGYLDDAQEVSIVVIDASTQKKVYTCTGEAQGESLLRRVQNAINRCMNKFIGHLKDTSY